MVVSLYSTIDNPALTELVLPNCMAWKVYQDTPDDNFSHYMSYDDVFYSKKMGSAMWYV